VKSGRRASAAVRDVLAILQGVAIILAVLGDLILISKL